MNWSHFKDPVSNTCLSSSVVIILVSNRRSGLMVGSNPFTVMTNTFVIEFSENTLGKLNCIRNWLNGYAMLPISFK